MPAASFWGVGRNGMGGWKKEKQREEKGGKRGNRLEPLNSLPTLSGKIRIRWEQRYTMKDRFQNKNDFKVDFSINCISGEGHNETPIGAP